MPQYTGVTPDTQLRYPVGERSDSTEEKYLAWWSRQQYREVLNAHGNGVISGGQIDANGDVAAGEWLVDGNWVKTSALTTPSGKTNGVTNYIFVKRDADSFFNLTLPTCTIIAKTSSTPASDELCVGKYDVSGGGAVSNVVNTPLQIKTNGYASVSVTSGNVTNGLAKGESVDVTISHPQVSFLYSETPRVTINVISGTGYLAYVDEQRTTATQFVVVVTNVSGTETATFTITAVRQGIVSSIDLTQAASSAAVGSKYVLLPTRLLRVQTADVTAANTATETTLLSSALTLPANFFSVGRTVRVTARGVESNIATPGTLQLRVKLGTTAILDTGAQTPPDSLTNRGWTLQGEIVCRTTGATGTVMGQGGMTLSTSAAATQTWDCENTTTQTVDTTGTLALDVTAQWQTANAGNTLKSSVVVIEVLS